MLRTSGNRQIQIVGGGNPIIAAAPKRVGLIFWPSNVNSYSVDTQPLATSTLGGAITATCGPVKLTLEEDGSVVQQAWFAAATQLLTATITEIFEEGRIG